jgi:4a-hydroxytetrahydrobiopterin dehydratase
MARKLAQKKCKPCEGGAKPLGKAETARLLKQLSGWKATAAGQLRRKVKFEDFLTLMEFVNEVARLAEEEGHHPDFCVHYDTLDLRLWTHAVGGLSENDFILAAKIDALLGE